MWREADALPEIEHAWLFDHLMPIGGEHTGPIYEGWTLLSALAAQTQRLRLGLLVTSNRFRPPAMLAKIAATVDVVSDGRLDFGIGAGSRPNHPIARREYDAHGLPFHDFEHSMESLAEALTVIRRLWTEDEPFDFDGEYVRLTGAFGNPKPVQRPYPPIMIGGRTHRLLRVVAEHADLWNIPGGDIEDATRRSARLDAYCAEIGRDPAAITRSIFLWSQLRGPGRHPRGDRRSDRRGLPARRPRPASRPTRSASRSGSPTSSSRLRAGELPAALAGQTRRRPPGPSSPARRAAASAGAASSGAATSQMRSTPSARVNSVWSPISASWKRRS